MQAAYLVTQPAQGIPANHPFHEQLHGIEAELLEIWGPFTRRVIAKGETGNGAEVGAINGEPFVDFAMPRKRRIKWLLKRHRLMAVFGRDEGVLVVTSPRNPTKCHAHPTGQPHVDGESSEPERVPARIVAGSYAAIAPPATDTEIAFALRKPIRAVREALAECPPGQDRKAWASERLDGAA